MFEFEELCGKPLGAADYIAVVGQFSTVFLAEVPLFSRANLPEAYRFMTLVDVMYDHR